MTDVKYRLPIRTLNAKPKQKWIVSIVETVRSPPLRSCPFAHLFLDGPERTSISSDNRTQRSTFFVAANIEVVGLGLTSRSANFAFQKICLCGLSAAGETNTTLPVQHQQWQRREFDGHFENIPGHNLQANHQSQCTMK